MSEKHSWVTQITDTNSATSAHNDALGDIRWVGNKCYKYSLFTKGAIAAVVGHAVNYIATTGYTTNAVTADVSTADTIAVPAGVLVSAPLDGEYCWIQIKGPATLTATTPITGTTPAIGQGITAGATDSDFALLTDAGAGADSKIQCGVIQAAAVVLLDCPY